MKYFTRELWLEAQKPDPAGLNLKAWTAANARYLEQFDALTGRLDGGALIFFKEAEIHDGHLVSAKVRDGHHVLYDGSDDPPFNFHPVSASLILREIQEHHHQPV